MTWFNAGFVAFAAAANFVKLLMDSTTKEGSDWLKIIIGAVVLVISPLAFVYSQYPCWDQGDGWLYNYAGQVLARKRVWLFLGGFLACLHFLPVVVEKEDLDAWHRILGVCEIAMLCLLLPLRARFWDQGRWTKGKLSRLECITTKCITITAACESWQAGFMTWFKGKSFMVALVVCCGAVHAIPSIVDADDIFGISMWILLYQIVAGLLVWLLALWWCARQAKVQPDGAAAPVAATTTATATATATAPAPATPPPAVSAASASASRTKIGQCQYTAGEHSEHSTHTHQSDNSTSVILIKGDVRK
eukprot:TRINITY_DN45013_c0_g1_i1.p1 TRINITY_DN45013_c0_g1~~TRINITY_DN45013_c0_g1_i1.p1  ORF type:complete len:305 (+),score=39.03 TRINITY_DN45013_c0_g1_i1:315-1229(+)